MIFATDIRRPGDAPLEHRRGTARGWDLVDLDPSELDAWRLLPEANAPSCGLVLAAREVAARPELPPGRIGRIVLTAASTADPDAALHAVVEAALGLRWVAEARGIEVLLRVSDLPVTARTVASLIETVNSPRVRWEVDARGTSGDALAARIRLLDWRLGGVVVNAANLPDDLPGLLDEIGFDGFLHSEASDPAACEQLRAWIHPVSARGRES